MICMHSVESISQLCNLFHQVRNEGTFFTTLKFISPGNLQEQISHQWNLYNFPVKNVLPELISQEIISGETFSQEPILAQTYTIVDLSVTPIL